MLSISRLVFALFFLWSLIASANAADYKVGPPAGWVVGIEPARTRGPDAASGGQEYLLSDVQRRIEPGNLVTYVHLAMKAADSSGVDDSARFSIDFDPVYQSVTLHSIDLLRNGTRVSKLKSSTIRVLQRETELETRIYDGRKTINVEIDDMRVGDTVEYKYTINGANPVYANKFANTSYLQWNVPVDRVFLRLLAPVERKLHFDTSKAGAAAVVSEANGYRDYRWDRVNVPALRVDNDAPSHFDPYPRVQWSEFGDWGAVARWALPLYRRTAPSPELAREIARIAAASDEPEQRLRAALRLVQRDIRYLGVETGASSHAPAAASLVFQRRFGDCKDKAMLLLTMLDALGIRADPALVHNARLRAEETALASPHLFNHVLLRAVVKGVPHWIDPTRAEQHGDLGYLYQPDYGLALVIRSDTTTLTPMAAPARARRQVLSTFDASAGLEKPVGLEVSTTVQGSAAESLRAQLASKGLPQQTREYLNYYARLWPSIASAGELQVKDDKATNTITTTERYTISKFWGDVNKNGSQEVTFTSPEVRAKLVTPKALNRTAPLALDYPEELEEVTVVKVFDRWNVTPEKKDVRDDAFEYRHAVKLSENGRVVTVSDYYRALSDNVAPERMRDYSAKLTAADEATGMTLYWTENPVSAPVPAAMLYARIVLGMLLAAALLTVLILQARAPAAHKDINTQLTVAFYMLAAVLLIFAFELDTLRHLLMVLCISLTLLAIVTTLVAASAPATHWLHVERKGRRVHTMRDVLIGSSLTMLALPHMMTL